jgi:hypothetical protein
MISIVDLRGVNIMHKYIKTLVKVILTILPVFCILMFALSVGALVISLNPDVKWNEYNDEAYGLKSYYFNTIWTDRANINIQNTGKMVRMTFTSVFIYLCMILTPLESTIDITLSKLIMKSLKILKG